MDPELRKIWEVYMLALAMWREARNQPFEVIAIVGCSMRNRVLRPRWWGKTYVEVVLCRDQYSSFNREDPNAVKFPAFADQVFPVCLSLAAAIHDGVLPDKADGTDSYFDRSLDDHPPSWATDGSKTHVMDAGDFHFYRTLDAMAA